MYFGHNSTFGRPIWTVQRLDCITNTTREDESAEYQTDDADADEGINLSATNIETLRKIALLEQGESGENILPCKHLDDAPASIDDVFSSVLGDGFHFIDRPKILIKHEYKKLFKKAFMDAWYAWNPKTFAEVKEAMRNDGMDSDGIEANIYFNAKF
jgi:hypothetical protein